MIKIAFNPIYCHPLPEGHRFPMLKYELIPEQLLYEGTVSEDNFFRPQKAKSEDILRVHGYEYLDKLMNLTLSAKEMRKIGFPLSSELVERELIITQGTIDCAKYALANGVAFNIAGGTHHAYANSGEGFCILNDVAVASAYLLNKKMATRILVVDLDVHQGNGTAKIFENSPEVFTFSMHGKDNYPMHKENSDLDIPLENKMEDAEYLKILRNNLNQILENFKTDFIFYVSGVDVLATDKLGKLGLSREGSKERDKYVFSQALKLKIPIVVVMGGGYSSNIIDIVEAHCNTFRVASDLFVF